MFIDMGEFRERANLLVTDLFCCWGLETRPVWQMLLLGLGSFSNSLEPRFSGLAGVHLKLKKEK